MVVYLILGILYESYIHPITIISTLPSAGVGALATLMLFHFDFSLITLIGIILLIGIVKKNGIMLVDFALVAARDDHLSAHDAVRRAALLRFRPIMMTTMAAMLGGVPLMLGTGTGSELRQPLGYAIVGGLLVSQALTLFTTPVIYIYLDQLSDWISSSRTQTSGLQSSTASQPKNLPGHGRSRLKGVISANCVFCAARRLIRILSSIKGDLIQTPREAVDARRRRERPLIRLIRVRRAKGFSNEHAVLAQLARNWRPARSPEVDWIVPSIWTGRINDVAFVLGTYHPR